MNEKELHIVKGFVAIKPDLETWGKYVDSTLINTVLPSALGASFIKIHPESRVKSDKSYLDKALYRYQNYTDPLSQIIDKVGTRIVALKSDQIELIANVILEFTGWKARITKNLKAELQDKPKNFDYQSMHLVVEPLTQPEGTTADIKYLTCEIQVRTLLQHAFAEVSHDSVYKGPYQNDHEMLRHLSKSMALMEATDDYFCLIFNLMKDEAREYGIYTNELIRLFKKYNPAFDRADINFDLSDRIYKLMELIKKVEIAELDIFLQKNDAELKTVMIERNGLMFQQPVGLLIAYYFKNHQTKLKNEWPMNIESLKTVYNAFNTAFDNY